MRKHCLKIFKYYYMNVVEALQSKYVELSIKFHRQLEVENQNPDTQPQC